MLRDPCAAKLGFAVCRGSCVVRCCGGQVFKCRRARYSIYMSNYMLGLVAQAARRRASTCAQSSARHGEHEEAVKVASNFREKRVNAPVETVEMMSAITGPGRTSASTSRDSCPPSGRVSRAQRRGGISRRCVPFAAFSKSCDLHFAQVVSKIGSPVSKLCLPGDLGLLLFYSHRPSVR